MTALRTGRPVRNVVMGVFNPKVEQHHWISIDAVPLFRPGEDKPHRVFTTFDDITERKRAEEALRTQTHDLRERVKELRCLYGISALVEKGSTFAEILQGVADLIPPSWQYPEITCARVVLDGQEHKSDNFKESCWTQTSDIHVHGEVVGSVEVFYLEEKPEDAEGPFLKEERALLNAIAERVGRLTEHKRAEDQIRRALHEKDVLLREIHHRVKNNLQIVISLLRLQSRQVVDEEALRAFANSEERIMAMALLHEMLYSSDNLGQVSCQDYVGKLVAGLSRVQGRAGGAILTADVAETSIDLDHAVPMGLILTELVSNALKHAFPGNRQGEVRISVQPVEGDQLEIVVSDDGVGVPVDFDLQETRSLGLRLVEMLAKQLGGTLRVSREDGTTFTVRFKHAPADGRA